LHLQKLSTVLGEFSMKADETWQTFSVKIKGKAGANYKWGYFLQFYLPLMLCLLRWSRVQSTKA
jgi:hypothetical protein